MSARADKRVAPDERAVDLPALGATLRAVLQFAAGGGATESWLDEVAATFMSTLLELQERRSGGHDPRRRRSRELALRIASAREAGVSPEALVERFARSKSQVYKLLKAVARDRATVSLFTSSPRSHNRVPGRTRRTLK